ncbi:MAG: hypothetical protein JKX68_02120 [Flavobacteriales bacterium]|nr:hypothetical protein [Flavobacteriales bacterium]
MKLKFLIALLFLSGTTFSQVNRFLANVDTNLLTQNTYIAQYGDFGSFFGSGLSEEELIPYDIDQELLNATVFFMLNKVRKQKHRKALAFSPKLELSAYNFVKQYSVFKFRKLKNNNARISKVLPFLFKKLSVKQGISKGLVVLPQLVDYKFGKRFYYDKNDNETDLQMFYGRKRDSDKEEEGLLKIPIPTFTYKSFAEKLIKNLVSGYSGRFARSKSYTMSACYVEVDEKSLYRRKIPRARVIIILSGKRTAHIIASK